jgi:micrococcal nuclease
MFFEEAMELTNPYRYRAELIRVVDGDTVDLKVDLGFYLSAALRFRVLGLDTPELRGGTPETKAKARRAKEFVLDLLSSAAAIYIKTEKADSFGRWLAEVQYSPDGEIFYSLATRVIKADLGEPRDR